MRGAERERVMRKGLGTIRQGLTYDAVSGMGCADANCNVKTGCRSKISCSCPSHSFGVLLVHITEIAHSHSVGRAVSRLACALFPQPTLSPDWALLGSVCVDVAAGLLALHPEIRVPANTVYISHAQLSWVVLG